jgi:hypothetical protein
MIGPLRDKAHTLLIIRHFQKRLKTALFAPGSPSFHFKPLFSEVRFDTL